jgi:osmotically-inducible protein OsmY
VIKSDSELRRDVERELEWEPSIDARGIGVSVVDSIVTLTGEVSSYAEKWKAERAAERVAGVRGVVNEIEVKTSTEHSDTDIARAAVDALARDVMVPADRIKVRVEKGWVTLKGEVSWDYQRRGHFQSDHRQTSRRAARGETTHRGDLQARGGYRR